MNARMRIAIYYNVGFGGGRRWLYSAATRLGRYHDVDLYCINRPSLGAQFPDGTDLAEHTRVWNLDDMPRVPGPAGKLLNIPASYADFLRFDRLARRVARHIDAQGYDLVFASIGDYTYAPLVLRHLKTRSAYYCHEPMRTAYEPDVPRPYIRTASGPGAAWRWLTTDFAGLRRRWDAQAVRRAATVIVNSAYTQDYARRAYGIDTLVNHPGVDVTEFTPGATARQRFVLSGPGAIIRSKGYDWAIRAIGSIPAEKRPPLVIAGNAEHSGERAFLEQAAREHGVSLDIRVAVPDGELKELLRTASVMLYTPHLEPFGIAPLEAMASGTPVVAVREAGPIETVVDGATGFLCERDPRQLGDAVLRLLDDGPLRASMGAAGREHVEGAFTWDRSVEELAGLLSGAARERSSYLDETRQEEAVVG
jgi:glycosyltransferase involved in cell wall biosynthesis